MVVSPPSVKRPPPPVPRPTRRPSRFLVTSRPWRASRDRPLRRPSRHAAARPARTVGHARAVRARGLPAPPRRRFVAGRPGWADGAGSGGEGKRGRTPRRGARGDPSARAGRVTRRSGRIAVPISVVFVTLVLPQTGRPRRRRSVVHAAVAAPPAGGRQMPSLPFITWRPCYRRAGRMGRREDRGSL